MTSKNQDGMCNEEQQNLFAKKTFEHLQVISIAEIILKEKFNGDTNFWMTSLYEALALRNPAYLLEERNFVNDSNTLTNLNDELKDSFWERNNHDKVLHTGFQLINIFNKFMIGLNKNVSAFDFGDSLSRLKQIEKNVHSYIMKQSEVNIEVSENFSSQTNSNTKSKELVKPSENSICDVCNGSVTIFNNDLEFSIDLHSQEKEHKRAIAKTTFVVDPDGKTTAKPRPKLISISDQASKHLVKHNSEADLLTLEEEHSVRLKLRNSIKNHSNFITILTRNEFFCELCKCNISSMQNVESHVEGTRHSKAHETLMKKPPADDVFQVDDANIPVAELKM